MLPSNGSIVFNLERRTNTFRKSGKEWALIINFVDRNKWTMVVWERKPSESTIREAKDLILRSFEFYHKHLQIPRFSLDVIEGR